MPIQLGQFTLDEVAGSGGAGVVWRGQHARLGLPVAVKVLPPRPDRHALHAHKNEVQAVARLHHPHIVNVLDVGVIDKAACEAALAAGATLVDGSPWLAMELASGGDLSKQRAPFAWPVVVDVLRSLLSALAHAHARGVIHKDLKPQNVLLCVDGDVRPGLKLSDFGLALSEKGERIHGGTPLYMAPEQFEEETGDIGPWTDLYALGCLAFWLVTGAPPFVDSDWVKLALRHMNDPPPRLPTVDMPSGLADWVARLLEKNPARRYRCAADADAALAALDPLRASPPRDRLVDGLITTTTRVAAGAPSADAKTIVRADSEATEILPPRVPGLARTGASAPLSSTSSGTSSSQPPPLEVGAARPPDTWRAPAVPRPDLRLVDAGLSLWGLRPVPLVGRDVERDRIWDALLEVHAKRAPRVVVVRGPSGVGKSRLVEWMSHRALETGAARVLRATFQPLPGRGDGLAGLVARACGLHALPQDASVKNHAALWLQRWLTGADLTPEELCALAGRLDGVFTSSDERQSALVRFLLALARERPLVVWLDDVQDGKEGLALVARVLADAPELPVLFLATAVDELLDDDGRARLEHLGASPGARELRLQPLDEGAHDELCAKLLGGQAGGLADELRRRTEGNVLFAVHVVGEWIGRGLVEVGERGLVLKRGASPELPEELHALWDRRITQAVGDAALDRRGAVGDERRALELAAVLGSSVDLVEWEEALREAHIDVRAVDTVIDRVAAAGLARRTEGGFQFAHAMVRGSVERRAREAGRVAEHHASAARALTTLWGTDTPAASARIGRHLLAAGAPVAALAPLLAAARAAVEESAILEAAAVLADWERARAQLFLDDGDPRVAPGLVLMAQVAHHEGRHDEARDLARRAAKVAVDQRLRAAALRVLGHASVAVGDLDSAVSAYDDARDASARVDDKAGVGAAVRGFGDVDYWRGDYAAAAARYHQVASIFAVHGKKSDLAASLWSVGYVEMERGAYDEAHRLFLEQRKVARAARDRLNEANAENALGELARRRGQLDEAEKRYKTAARIASANGLSRRWVYRLNLAHLKVVHGDAQGAGAIAAELLASNAAREAMVVSSAWWIVAMACAERGDLPAFDRAVDSALATPVGAMVEKDLISVAQRAGDAVARHDRTRAERAWTFAREKRRAVEGESA